MTKTPRPRLVLLGFATAILSLPMGPAPAEAQTITTPDAVWVRFTTENGLPSNRVVQIIDDRHGTVWARTGFGLSWFDGYRWRPLASSSAIARAQRVLAHAHPAGGLLMLRDSTLFHVDTAHVTVLTRGTQLMEAVAIAPLDTASTLVITADTLFRVDSAGLHDFPTPPGLAEGGPDLNVVGTTRSGAVVAATGSGTFRWNGAQWDLLTTESTGRFRDGGRPNEMVGVRWSPRPGLWSLRAGASSIDWIGDQDPNAPLALDVDPAGNAIAIYGSGGVRIRDGNTWRWLDPVPEPLRQVSDIRFDPAGDLWASTDQGVYLLRPPGNRWVTWALADAPTANEINEVLPTVDGEIWLATGDGLVVHRPGEPPRHIRSAAGRTLGPLTALAQDVNGDIWTATAASSEGGAFRYRGGDWTYYGSEAGFPAAGVHRIAPDQSGALWFLLLQSPPTDSTRALRWDGERFESIGLAQGLQARRLYDFAEGTDGSRWFGTGSGLWEWRDNRWTQWGLSEGLRTDRVFTVTLDRNNRPWFGHYVRGLGLGHVRADGDVEYLGQDDGLPHEAVWDLEFDTDDRLWITTSGGLGVLRDGMLLGLQEFEGLSDDRLWPVSVTDSMILVGTNSAGLAGIGRTARDRPSPRVEVDDIVVDGERAVMRWTAAGYRGLPRGEDLLTRYRVDDEPWSAWSTVRQATISRLGSGEHTFAVEVQDSPFSTGGSAVAVDTFRVAPPWLRHPLFLAGVVLWILSMLVAGWFFIRRAREHDTTLRQRERYFRSLIENAADLITVLDEKGRISYQSPSVTRILGYRQNELEGRPVSAVLHPDHHEEVSDILRRGAEGQRFVDLPVRHADGTWRVLESIGLTVHETDSAPYTVINSRDVTAARRDQDRLRDNEELTRLVIDTALDAVVTVDQHGVILRWNSQAERIFGWSQEEARGRNLADTIIPERYREPHRAGLKRFLATGEARVLGRRIQIEGLRRDGTEFPVELSIRAVGTRTHPRFSAFIRDITEQQQAQEELRQSEERYRRLFATAGDAIIVVDLATRRIIEANDRAVDTYGYARAELLDQDPTNLSADPEGAAAAIEQVSASGSTVTEFQSTHKRKDGTPFPVDIRAGVFSAADQTLHAIVVRDLTDRHELEQQLRQAQKMEALGTLAGGIAHDFNNILLAITGYTDLVRAEPELNPKSRRYVEQVATAADRAAGLVRQILAFSRRTEPELKLVDFADVLHEALGLVRASIPSTIELRTDIDVDTGSIMADAPQMHQIMLNLSSNAVHAMDGGGVLFVSAASVVVDEMEARRIAPDLEPGPYVQLTVRDTGAGIESTRLDRIFDPFFTTKAVGRGTGLGLSAVHGNVMSHGGAVTVDSVVGKGTTFRLFFPRVGERVTVDATPRPEPVSGVGRVLFVDDENQIADLGRIALERSGFQVRAHVNSEEAIREFTDDPEAFDAVVTDLTMPRRTGFDVAEVVKHHRPDLPVILTTGHADRINDSELSTRGVDHLLLKPYTSHQLAAAVGRAIEARDGGATAA